MAHEVETMVSAQGQVPWHGLGTVVDDEGMTSARALELGGLDWEVEKCPAVAEIPTDEGVHHAAGQDMYMTVRNIDNKPLGQVGSKYQVLQNREAFQFGDDLVDSGDAHWITAGSLKGGKTVWMMMKMTNNIKIDGYDDETVQPYILISNSHDASSSVTAAITNVRVVCNNTLTWALDGTSRKFNIRHTKQMMGKINEAKRVLGVTHNYLDTFQNVASDLLNSAFTDAEFDAFLESLNPTEGKEKRALTIAENMQDDIKAVYKNTPDLQNITGTRWGALQAVVDYHDHHKGGDSEGKEENRFSRILTSPNLTHKAFKILQEA